MSFRVSQSGIKDMSFQGEIRDDYCPRKWYANYVLLERFPPTEPMIKGLYFEYITGINEHSGVKDLERAQRTGKKKVAQTRLEDQALVFKKLCAERAIQVNCETTQRSVCCPWDDTGYVCPECKSENVDVRNIFQEYPHFPYAFFARCNHCGTEGNACDFAKVVIEGVYDILTPYWKVTKDDSGIDVKEYINLGIIDLKTSTDVTSDYEKSEYSWGNIKAMDLIQSVLYPYIFYRNTGIVIPFAYLVFDYKKKPQHRWVHSLIDMDSFKYVEETIRKIIDEIRYQWNEGWIPVGSKKECKNCIYGKSEDGDGSCKHYTDDEETEVIVN